MAGQADVTQRIESGSSPGAEPSPSAVRTYLLNCGSSSFADRAFSTLMLVCALSIFAIVVLILIELISGSKLTIQKFGMPFFFGSAWDPVNGNFGALPFIYGTVVSSILSLIIAVPLAVGVAIFLTEMSGLPARLPGLLYGVASRNSQRGLWPVGSFCHGSPTAPVFVSVPHQDPGLVGDFCRPELRVRDVLSRRDSLHHDSAHHLVPYPRSHLGSSLFPARSGAGPGSHALGDDSHGVLRNARIGIVGAVILGLGRALGETMAVTMVIGNRPEIARSLLAPAYSMASVIANEFSEAADDLSRSALIEIGLALFIVTIIVNALARVLVWAVTRGAPVRGT